MKAMSQQLYLINAYNIYGECVRTSEPHSKAGLNRITGRGGKSGPTFCIDSRAASHFMNQDSVIAATHVVKQDFHWGICSTSSKFTYHSTRPNLPRDTYPFLNDHINVLIYNGDWDACVPYTDNQDWVKNMGYDVAEDWHQWFYNGPGSQVGGYAIRYKTTHDFTFLTIRGGRHEVPETAPAHALEMLDRLFNGTPF